MRIIGLIPARGGSKGITRKNLQPLAGHPLIARKILQAIESGCTEVWVTTDDEEISKDICGSNSCSHSINGITNTAVEPQPAGSIEIDVSLIFCYI